MARENFVVIKLEQKNSHEVKATDERGSIGNGAGKYINQIKNLKRILKLYGNDAGTIITLKLFDTGRTRVMNTKTITAERIPKNRGNTKASPKTPEISDEQISFLTTINESVKLRPTSLILSDVKWKYLVRSVLRGKNLMMTGPAGCGKTLAVTSVANAMNRPLFYFNLGATQDPRSTLIGNTHFNKDTGTYFAESTFVKAIQTENAVILLDELSRAHPEAWNILMTVLDETQRYLRVDEAPDTPVVRVASGVSFLATANIGMEYTSTRTIDRAIQDRFQILEMDQLTKQQQTKLITNTYPELDTKLVGILADIYDGIQNEVGSESGRLSTSISTRVILQAAGLLIDGFSITDAAEVSIYPYFDGGGGTDSERVYVKQLVQRFIPDANLRNSKMFAATAATN